MVLLDVLGQKWTLRILWELAPARVSFRKLRELCDDVSPTLLNNRLKQLRDLKFVDLERNGFGLTEHGQELVARFMELDGWAYGWSEKIKQ